jgi:cellulose biosynthesis protein BcsQ
MEIALLNSNRDLYQQLKNINGIELVEIMAQWEEVSKKYDVVIISDRLMSVDEVRTLKQQNVNKIFIFMVENQTKSEVLKQIKFMCATHNIHFIPPYFEGGKIAVEIEKILFPNSYSHHKGKVISFMSTHPGAGSTAVVLAAAESISKQIEGRIAVLNLNPWDEGVYEKEKGKSLDEIYTAIKNNSLDHDQLFQSFSKQREFYVLQGNRDLKKIIRYDHKTISRLIKMSEELFDLVLVDVGAHMENALSIQGMLSADMHYVVTTQEIKGIYSFSKTQEQIMDWLKFDPTHFLLIVNQVSNKRTTLPGVVSQKLNVPLLLEIQKVSAEQIESVENGNKFLSEIKETEEPFTLLSRGIIEEYQLPLKQRFKEQKNKGFFSIFGSSKTAVKEG